MVGLMENSDVYLLIFITQLKPLANTKLRDQIIVHIYNLLIKGVTKLACIVSQLKIERNDCIALYIFFYSWNPTQNLI